MKILVVGEICRDIFVYGEVKRLSPEAPVPVFVPKSTTKNFGMAGNVVANLETMGDHHITAFYQQDTIEKTRYVDEKSNHMFIRIDTGEDAIKPIDLTRRYEQKLIKDADLVIISDYNKGFLTDDDIATITYHAKFSVLDTKRKLSNNILEYVNFVKLNHSEYLNNKEWMTYYKDKLIITLGADGAQYCDKNFPSPAPKETIDVSGAGDTFTAAFALKVMETQNVEDAIIYANEMASIVVSKRGVATP